MSSSFNKSVINKQDFKIENSASQTLNKVASADQSNNSDLDEKSQPSTVKGEKIILKD